MSTAPGNVFERRFPNELRDLIRVIEEAVSFLESRGVTSDAVHLAHLTMEEMATNILKYGFDDSDAHEILLQVQIEPGFVSVLLEDDGHEFNPWEAPEPDLALPIEQRQPGGLGIHLVRNLAAHTAYERLGGRNRLTIRIPYKSE